MRTLIRTGSTVAWLGLVALTLISWFLGTDHRFNSANHAGRAWPIFVVAVFKLRLWACTSWSCGGHHADFERSSKVTARRCWCC
jgi:hypothetical protein